MAGAGLKFRKVKGRIIPIAGSRENKKKAAVGVGLAVAGAAVAIGAGVVYRKQVTSSLKFAARGWSGMEKAGALGGQAANRVRNSSLKFLARGSILGQAASASRIIGVAVGSAAIGAGVAKIQSARDPKGSPHFTKTIGTVAATTAFLTGAYGLAGTRAGLKSTYIKSYDTIRTVKRGLHL